MKLTTTAGLLLCVVPVALLGAFLAAPPSPFRTLPALALGIVLVVVLQLVLWTRDPRSAPFDILIVGIVSAFFLLRLPVLWLAPDLFIYPVYAVRRFGSGDLPWTLTFLILGVLAAAGGFRLGVGWRPWNRPRLAREAAPLLRLPMTRLVMLALTYFAIEMGLWVFLGTASSSLGTGGPATSGGLLFLRHFVSLYAATGIGLAVGLDRWKRFGILRRIQFCGFIGLFVFYTIAGGSRSGLITLTIMATLYLLVRQGNFRIGGRAVAIAVLVPLLAVVIFPIATIVRYGWVAASQRGAFTLDAARGKTAADDSFLVSGVKAGTNRLNGLDPLLMITNRKEARPLWAFVSYRQMSKSAVNLLVPSAFLGREPFPGVIQTSRLFSVVYRGQPLWYINTWYQTDMWTFWGSAFALGGWGGGHAVMFAVSLFLGFGYRRIIKRAGRLGLLWRLWWLYSCYLVLVSYGFDVDFAAAISLLVGGTVVVILLRPRTVKATQSALPPQAIESRA